MSAVGRRRPGRAVHRRRRLHLHRLQHRRHVDVLRLRARAGRARRQPTHGARQPVPAADRGCDRRAEELPRRYGLPKWQFTLSATQANTEAIRVARVIDRPRQGPAVRRQVPRTFRRGARRARTRRLAPPEEHGLPAGATGTPCWCRSTTWTRSRRPSRAGDIALVLTEPAMTNNVGLILPEDGFHAELRRLTRSTGTLLALDETHTQVVGPGGLTARGAWSRTSHRGQVDRRRCALRGVGHDRNDRACSSRSSKAPTASAAT